MGVGIVLYRKKVKGRYPVDTVKESVPKNDGDDMQEKNTKDIIDESEMESKASPPSSTAIHSDTMKIWLHWVTYYYLSLHTSQLHKNLEYQFKTA